MSDTPDAVLQNWSTSYGMDARYLAPECRPPIRLQGRVYGHPDFEEGDTVVTSRIDKIDGRLITTSSGSTYRLGRPSQKWVHWLKKEGRTYDPKNPIKDMRRS